MNNYVGVDAKSIFWVSGYIYLGNFDDNAEAIGVFWIVMNAKLINAVVQDFSFYLPSLSVGRLC
ncbi:hypothetical protein ACQKMY_23860 [Peribacillus frigoritolerans]|uniref:hypothetical protein n=1 Tax=Peribacillus frigoritolerans TaxID=450367 RepID=UPI003D08D41E